MFSSVSWHAEKANKLFQLLIKSHPRIQFLFQVAKKHYKKTKFNCNYFDLLEFLTFLRNFTLVERKTSSDNSQNHFLANTPNKRTFLAVKFQRKNGFKGYNLSKMSKIDPAEKSTNLGAGDFSTNSKNNGEAISKKIK